MNSSHLPVPHQPKRSLSWLLCLGLTIPIGLLVACSALSNPPPANGGDNGTTPPAVESTAENATNAEAPPETLPVPPADASAADLRAYYESLVAELNQALLDERTDRFISEYEYEKRLDELEDALAEALERIDGATDDGNTDPSQQVGATPETPPLGNGASNDTAAGGADVGTEDAADVAADYTYTIKDGQATIQAYIGSEENVSIPAAIEGCPVTAIAEGAFKNTDVTSVVIPHTVTSVGWFAFYGCYGLESVTVPASVTTIAYAAFDGCPSVTLHCAADSYAAKYATSFGLKCTVT